MGVSFKNIRSRQYPLEKCRLNEFMQDELTIKQLNDQEKVQHWLAKSDNSGLEDLIDVKHTNEVQQAVPMNTYNFDIPEFHSRKAVCKLHNTETLNIAPAGIREDRAAINQIRQDIPQVGRCTQEDDDGESVKSCCSIRLRLISVVSRATAERGQSKQKIWSGYLDKPKSIVVQKLRWPDMNQNPRYVTEPLTFNQLNFPQFIGGATRTITKVTDPEELQGWLWVMSKVAYLYDQCKSWEKARSVYFAILSGIEEGESTWSNSFTHYDLMCPIIHEKQAERSDT